MRTGKGGLDPDGLGEDGWWKVEYDVRAGNDTTTWEVSIRGTRYTWPWSRSAAWGRSAPLRKLTRPRKLLDYLREAVKATAVALMEPR